MSSGDVTRDESAWRAALADEPTRAALDEGLADLAAGRVERWTDLTLDEAWAEAEAALP